MVAQPFDRSREIGEVEVLVLRVFRVARHPELLPHEDAQRVAELEEVVRFGDAAAPEADEVHARLGRVAQFGAGALRGLADHLQLIVVGHKQGRTGDGVEQIVPGKRRDLLAGVVDVPDALFAEQAGKRLHVVEVAGGYDAPVGGSVGMRKRVLAREPHRGGVESVDLVVVLVGDQRAARGEFVLHDADAFKRNPLRFEERAVFGKILARRGEDKRLFAHQRQRIGDVPRAAAALFHQPVDEEAYIQNMQLVGEDVVGERAVKGHDTVESQRAGDINGHHSSGCVDSVIQARKSASPRATGRATMQGVS